MNKILWAMLSLIILGLGFLLLMKNPTWIVAQKTLPVMGLERLLGQTNLIATMS